MGTWAVVLAVGLSGCDGLTSIVSDDGESGLASGGDEGEAVTVERLPDPPGFEDGASVRALAATTSGFYVVVGDGNESTPDRIAGWEFDDPRWDDFGPHGSVIDIASSYRYDDGFDFWFVRYADDDSGFEIRHSTGPDATLDLRVARIDRIAVSGGPHGRIYLDSSFDHVVAETYTYPGAWETIGREEGTLDEGFLPSDAGERICEMQGATERDAVWILTGGHMYLLEARSVATVWDITSTNPGCSPSIVDDGEHMVVGSGASVISYSWADRAPEVLIVDVGAETPLAGSGFGTEAVDLKEGRVYASHGKVYDVRDGDLVGGYLPSPDLSDQESAMLLGQAAQPDAIMADPRHNAVYLFTGDAFLRATWPGVLPDWECPHLGC